MNIFSKLICEALMTGEKTDVKVSDVNNAIDNLRPVIIRYWTKGKPVATGRRYIYPVAYGLTKAGNPVIRAFEPYGDTTTKVPAWKFFRLDRIKRWRCLNDKTFQGKPLEGLNRGGDMTMSVVYNIVNLDKIPDKESHAGPVTKKEIEKPSVQTPEIPKPVPTDNINPAPEDKFSGIKQQLSQKRMLSPELMAQMEREEARKKLAKAKRLGIKLDNEDELKSILNRQPKAQQNLASEPVQKVDIDKQKLDKEVEDETSDSKMLSARDVVNDLLRGIKQQTSGEKTMVSPEVLQSIERENARKQLAKARRTGQKLDNEKELLDIIKGRATNNSTKSAPVTKSEVNANSEITPDDIESLKKAWGLA